MYQITVRADDFGDILGQLGELRNFRPEFGHMEKSVVDIAQEEHRRARLAGLSVTEDDLPAPAKSTREDRRRGPGPRLMPDPGSSFGSALVVIVTPAQGTLRIATSYGGVPWLRYHVPGPDHSSRLPIANVEGLQLRAVARIDELIGTDLDRQVREAIDGSAGGQGTGVRGAFGRAVAFFA
jgi:hypothetical protein